MNFIMKRKGEFKMHQMTLLILFSILLNEIQDKCSFPHTHRDGSLSNRPELLQHRADCGTLLAHYTGMWMWPHTNIMPNHYNVRFIISVFQSCAPSVCSLVVPRHTSAGKPHSCTQRKHGPVDTGSVVPILGFTGSMKSFTMNLLLYVLYYTQISK